MDRRQLRLDLAFTATMTDEELDTFLDRVYELFTPEMDMTANLETADTWCAECGARYQAEGHSMTCSRGPMGWPGKEATT